MKTSEIPEDRRALCLGCGETFDIYQAAEVRPGGEKGYCKPACKDNALQRLHNQDSDLVGLIDGNSLPD